MKAYMTVTVHFISLHFIMLQRLLQTVTLDDNPTAINIAKVLKKVMENWLLPDTKIVAVFIDNGANVKRAIRGELHLRWVPCFAHTLNLVVSDAVKSSELSSLLDRCRDIVSFFFKRSAVATAKLNALAKDSSWKKNES